MVGMNSGISRSASEFHTDLAKKSTEASTQPGSLLWPLVWAFVFFVFLWAMDFPKPFFDDLFYNGAALNLAQGGDFSNPLLARQGFPNHFFFVYPPLHSYAVYAWLSVFGISSVSLLAFQNLMHFIIAAAMVLILRRHNSPRIFWWLAPLGVAAVYLKPGLRPEPLAVALTMAGYVLLIYCRTAGFRCWIAFFLMFLGASAAPRTAPFAAALAAVGGWEWLRSEPGNKLIRLRFCALAGLGLAATGVVFLALIQFRLKEFLETFRMHSQRLGGETLVLLHRYTRELESGWMVILWLTLIVLCASIRRPVDNLRRICYCVAGVFVFLGFAGALGHGSSWYVIFVLFLLAGHPVSRFTGMWRAMLPWTIAVLLLVANSRAFLGAFGQLTGRIEQTPPENVEAIRQMRPTAEQHLLLDNSVARYVFDYRVPAGYVNFEFAAPFPRLTAGDWKLQDDDLYLLGPEMTLSVNGRGGCYYTIEWWNAFGFGNTHQFKNPRQVYFVPARDLKGKATAQTVNLSGPAIPK